MVPDGCAGIRASVFLMLIYLALLWFLSLSHSFFYFCASGDLGSLTSSTFFINKLLIA